MKIIDPYYEFITPIDGEHSRAMLRLIESAARTCYKSEGCSTSDSAGPFVRNIAQHRKHVSVIEHVNVTVRFVCDRGVSHELVRHRLAAYSQESTRYCNYGKDKFGREITVIKPVFWTAQDPQYAVWYAACKMAEEAYMALLDVGAKPQEARSVLPNSLKTEVVATYNLRTWQHVLTLRTSEQAHPQMRQLMCPLLAEFKRWIPELFDHINPDIPPATRTP